MAPRGGAKVSDLRDQIRRDEGPLQELLASIPGFDGYREREIRRTADQLLREHLVTELDRVRDELKRVVATWAQAGKLQQLEQIDRLSRLMGKARDNIRFADYGYTGFFDAIKIGEEQLDRLYEYDQSLRTQITGCSDAVCRLAAAEDAAATERMAALETAIHHLQEMIDRRGEVVAEAAGPAQS
jgi:hypothetical protein